MPDGKPGGVPDRPPNEDFSGAVERTKSRQGFDEKIAAVIRQRLASGGLPSGGADDDDLLEAVRRRVNPRLIEVLRGYLT